MKLKTYINKNFLKPKIKNKGKNNIINISKFAYLRKVFFKIYGSNNTIIIEDFVYLHKCTITIGFSDYLIDNCKVHIKKGSTCNSLVIQLGESQSEVIIGENCMISFGVEISCTDTHSILDMDGNILNIGKNIEIGSHVWLCKKSTILKNTKIPNNSIVAQGSIVTQKYDKENIILAGNPAKIVKENINWTTKRPQEYISISEKNK